MTYQGSCHCGKIKFSADLDLSEVVSCNCSMCQRKGTLLSFTGEKAFTLHSGEGELADYQFGKKSIHHLFCKTCGVTAFSTGTAPDGIVMKAVNVRCLDGVEIEKLKIHHFNGRDM